MGQPVIQTSFNSGEWAPSLYSRVDLQKYHSGAALLQNFFVDYRGGATTRPGTRYVLQAKSPQARLIPFKASFLVTYILEFGPGYIRFFNNGAPVLENAKTITSAAAGPPEVFTSVSHGYSNGDWIFAGNVYYIIANATTNTFTLTDLFGNPINTNPFTLPTSAQRVYTITSPFAAADLFLLKYVQDVNLLFICHPNYPPQVLTLNAATNWTLAAISFVPTVATPTGLSITQTGTGSSSVAYVVTAVDASGQESSPSTPVQSNSVSGAGATTQSITWTTVPKAVAYNVYRTIFSNTSSIPAGVPFGFVGSTTSNAFIDTSITADFSNVAPTPENPFQGAGVQTVTVTNHGSGYTTVPSVSFTAAPGGGVTATGFATMFISNSSLASQGSGFVVGSQYAAQGYPSVVITVTAVNPSTLGILLYTLSSSLILSSGLPTQLNFFGQGIFATINISWSVNSVILTNPGAGYLTAPSVSFSFGGAAAVTTLGAGSSGNPAVPSLIQQRLFLGGPVLSPAQFNLSQPGAPFNFNVSFPTDAGDAIQGTLTSTTLHQIKAAIPVQLGLMIFTDQAAWLLNGGSPGSPISAISVSANPQGYTGSSDLPPIATATDLLYVQAKQSIVRDLAFNFYLNNFIGSDISILSSHLFYGFSLIQWAFAEEPFKLIWAIRNDGVMLCLTFLKEQEVIAWSQHNTQGTFTSVAAVNENTPLGNVDAVYVLTNRTINGVAVGYIERLVDLTYPNDYKSSWQVDAGIGYNGPPATTFSGAQQLGGMVVTGLADGVVINFTMPPSGTFVFGPGGTPGLTGIASASIVTVGLSFLPTLTTLPLDLGEPTVQSKRKKISGVTLKVNQALGLSMGRSVATALPLQDLILNNVGSMTNTLVTGLVTGDVRGYMDPLWDVPGQYTIQQTNPYPATVLGVVPEIDVGDTGK